ncbi:unnamed protein product [Lactuca saligna]|uniref:Uncharacterized protein n=1 Tax=Lactuca saligna TaxID=75948 RepID=A0AA36EEU9_LACSI|nr:unnamed protein product [Lactuca saligna]
MVEERTLLLVQPGSMINRFHGEYLGKYVAVKILRSEHLNDATLGNEFSHKDINHSLQMHSSFIRRLYLERELEAHQGCVNTIAWNSKGSLLIFGSDDAHVHLPTFFLHMYKLPFVPETSDELVASGAGDTEVTLLAFCSLLHSFTCLLIILTHTCRFDYSICLTHMKILLVTYQLIFNATAGELKKLAVEPGNPNVVWSASEDATLRQHDLQEVTSCPPAKNSASRPLSKLRIAEELEAAARAKGEFKNQESEGEIHPNDGFTEAK